MIDVAFAQAPSAGPPPSGGEQFLFTFAPLIAIAFIFYFMIIRPQHRKQKETERMLAGIKKGDRVLTSGGIFGTVVGTKDEIVVLKVADDVKVEFNRQSIVRVQARSE
ncbi:MAG TPA: preprotein translocase subunit YajC [Candidatus Eisenbacteria bacterium]|jgi:preprotein translocase subunit YajC